MEDSNYKKIIAVGQHYSKNEAYTMTCYDEGKDGRTGIKNEGQRQYHINDINFHVQ